MEIKQELRDILNKVSEVILMQDDEDIDVEDLVDNAFDLLVGIEEKLPNIIGKL